MRKLIYNKVRSVPFIFLFILSIFSLYAFLGGVEMKTHNSSDLLDEFALACIRTPGAAIEHNDGSCNYPGAFDLLKLDEEFDDNQTKYVYLKVKGDFKCGEIGLNPKSSTNCYNDKKVPGPQCDSGTCNTESCDLVEIGYWENCDPNSCFGSPTSSTIGGHTITFYGFEEGEENYSYWYYKVQSTGDRAISHLTFFLMCPDAAVGDFIWFDDNGDSAQDPSEEGINGIVLTLHKSDGTVLGTQTTGPQPAFTGEITTRAGINGYYRFDNLFAGDYYMTFVYEENTYLLCECNKDDDDIDNDFVWNDTNEAKTRDNINLEADEEDMTWDGGLAASTLPIHILDFSLTSIKNENHISWSIAHVINENYMALEKSYDGIEFFELQRFDELSEGSFSYIDDLNDKRTEVNYYRLAITDYNGKISYSKVIAGRTRMDSPSSSSVITYPNPSTGMVTVELLDNGLQMRSLSIDDLSGKRMMYLPLDNNKSITLSLKDRPELQGVFLIGVELSNGEVVYKRILLTY
jgi:hypothetical protein